MGFAHKYSKGYNSSLSSWLHFYAGFGKSRSDSTWAIEIGPLTLAWYSTKDF